jgi:hypothetical protein
MRQQVAQELQKAWHFQQFFQRQLWEERLKQQQPRQRGWQGQERRKFPSMGCLLC